MSWFRLQVYRKRIWTDETKLDDKPYKQTWMNVSPGLETIYFHLHYRAEETIKAMPSTEIFQKKKGKKDKKRNTGPEWQILSSLFEYVKLLLKDLHMTTNSYSKKPKQWAAQPVLYSLLLENIKQIREPRTRTRRKSFWIQRSPGIEVHVHLVPRLLVGARIFMLHWSYRLSICA